MERKLIDYDGQKYVDIMVYGTFDPPSACTAFIVVRMPNGRVPWWLQNWSKKIAPAINKLVRQWKRKDEKLYWNIDGEHALYTDEPRLWNTKAQVLKYEWNGQELVLAKDREEDKDVNKS